MEDLAVLSANLTWSRRQPQNIPEGESSDSLFLHVGGLHATTHEHPHWLGLLPLQIGDSVSIRVVEINVVES